MKTLSELIARFRLKAKEYSPAVESASISEGSDASIASYFDEAQVLIAKEYITTSAGTFVTGNKGHFRRVRPVAVRNSRVYFPPDIGNLIMVTRERTSSQALIVKHLGSAYGGDITPGGSDYVELVESVTAGTLRYLHYNSSLYNTLFEAASSAIATNADGLATVTFLTSGVLYGGSIERREDYYEGMALKFTSGAAVGYVYHVTAFDPTTLVLTLDRAWDVAPTAGDQFGTVTPLRDEALELLVYEAMLRLPDVTEDRYQGVYARLWKAVQMDAHMSSHQYQT